MRTLILAFLLSAPLCAHAGGLASTPTGRPAAKQYLGGKPLTRFLLDSGDQPLKRGTQSQLADYLSHVSPDNRRASAVAHRLLRSYQPDYYKRGGERKPSQKVYEFYEKLGAQYNEAQRGVSALRKELLRAKSDALGIRYFVEGTTREVKPAVITHRELSEHPVTNERIAEIKNQLTEAENAQAVRQEVISNLYDNLR